MERANKVVHLSPEGYARLRTLAIHERKNMQQIVDEIVAEQFAKKGSPVLVAKDRELEPA